MKRERKELPNDCYKVVDENGDIYFFNDEGKFHNEHGPAIIRVDDYRAWYINSKLKDTYHPDAIVVYLLRGETREAALRWINRKERPHSYELYMRDINRLLPELSE